MSELGLGCVKTPTFNLRVEIPSRFRKFESQKCLRPPLREDDRENNSAYSWLVHLFFYTARVKSGGGGISKSSPLFSQQRTYTEESGTSVPTADLHKRAGSGARPFEGANISTSEKDAGAMYEFMREFAALEPQPPELQRLFRTVHGNQAAMDGFGEYRSDFCRCSQKGPQCCCYC